MIKKAKLLLVENGLTLKDLASKTNLSVSTLSYTMGHSIYEWRIGFLLRLARATHKNPNQLFNYFVDNYEREDYKNGRK